jgi:hypothetical protein
LEVFVKKFLMHFSLATAVICTSVALGSVAQAQQQSNPDPANASPQATQPQQPDAAQPTQDPTATSPATQPQQPEAAQPTQQDAQMPASGEATTQDSTAFSGKIVKENGMVVLKDPVTKVSYKLDDTKKAKQYLNKQVKVTGKLDATSNTIKVEDIEIIS